MWSVLAMLSGHLQDKAFSTWVRIELHQNRARTRLHDWLRLSLPRELNEAARKLLGVFGLPQQIFFD